MTSCIYFTRHKKYWFDHFLFTSIEPIQIDGELLSARMTRILPMCTYALETITCLLRKVFLSVFLWRWLKRCRNTHEQSELWLPMAFINVLHLDPNQCNDGGCTPWLVMFSFSFCTLWNGLTGHGTSGYVRDLIVYINPLTRWNVNNLICELLL